MKMIVSMLNKVAMFKEKLKEEKGATAVEYGIMVALIAAVIITVVGVIGNKVENAFENVNNALK